MWYNMMEEVVWNEKWLFIYLFISDTSLRIVVCMLHQQSAALTVILIGVGQHIFHVPRMRRYFPAGQSARGLRRELARRGGVAFTGKLATCGVG